MSVRYWNTKNDPNYSNRHAEVDGIEFFAFPHQPYYARVGNKSAILDRFFHLSGTSEDEHREVLQSWGVSIYESCDPPGNSRPIGYQRFPEEEKDKAFEWAASQIKDTQDKKGQRK